MPPEVKYQNTAVGNATESVFIQSICLHITQVSEGIIYLINSSPESHVISRN